jgi:MoxR-like ATPase
VRRESKERACAFEGTKAYVATDDLKVAVNAAITLERPLLVKGEPAPARPCWRSKSPRRCQPR